MAQKNDFFARPATADEIKSFKEALTRWGAKQVGQVENAMGDRIQVKECTCCRVAQFHFDILNEERTKSVGYDPSRRTNAPVDPRVKFGVIDVWSSPTPASFNTDFKEQKIKERLSDTEHYEVCSPCKEAGKVKCDRCTQGLLKCSTCNGQGRYNCGTCNGYGGFDCGPCNSTGQAKYNCGTCRGSGKRDCNACRGLGQHHTNHGSSDCRSCGGTGKDYCGACGGAGKVTEQCRSCKGNKGYICDTCRGGKVLKCSTCDGDKTVTCKNCNGDAEVVCKPCQGTGGFKKYELIELDATIYPNQYFISALEDTRQKLSVTVNGVANETARELSGTQLDQLCVEENWRPFARELVESVRQNKPKTALQEKFQMLTGAFLEMKFIYDEKEYVTYLDYRQESLEHLNFDKTLPVLAVNPLAGKINRVKEQLVAQAQKAREARDPLLLNTHGLKAVELGFASEGSTWQKEAKEITAQLEREKLLAFKRRVEIPTYFLLPGVVWLIAGFFTPVSVMTLVMLYAVGVYSFKNQKAELKKEFILSDIKFFVMILFFASVVLIGLSIGYSEFNQRIEISRSFTNGIEL